MAVGLIIVTRNAEAFIGRTLAAVARQTRLPDEVVFVDCDSTDRTRAILEHATRGWPMPVRHVFSSVNLGFAAANNRAVALLERCELVALLNPDAVPSPAWLAALTAAADAHPEAASFASRLQLDRHAGVLDGAGDVCHVSGLVWRHGHGRFTSDVPEAARSRPVFAACAAAALYRRADWIRAGGLDERFFCYVEDVDLGFRMQLTGRGCWYAADAVADHAGSSTAGAGSAFAVYHGHRNLEWLFVKNMPAVLFWRYLLLHLLVGAVGLVWFAKRGRGGAFFRAKLDAVTGLRSAWRSRQAVQATRVLSAAQVRALLDRRSLWTRFGELRESGSPAAVRPSPLGDASHPSLARPSPEPPATGQTG